MDQIDFMIEVLQRVKRCSLALDNLKQAAENAVWKDEQWLENPKARMHVLNLIKESIILIECGKKLKDEQ